MCYQPSTQIKGICADGSTAPCLCLSASKRLGIGSAGDMAIIYVTFCQHRGAWVTAQRYAWRRVPCAEICKHLSYLWGITWQSGMWFGQASPKWHTCRTHFPDGSSTRWSYSASGSWCPVSPSIPSSLPPAEHRPQTAVPPYCWWGSLPFRGIDASSSDTSSAC